MTQVILNYTKRIKHMKIDEITNDLTCNDEGIWVSSTKENISYPPTGHSVCNDIEPTSFWYSHRNNCIKQIAKLYNFNEPFFDIGGGNGTVTKEFLGAGLNAFLLEPSMEGVINAKNSGVKDVIYSSFSDAKFKNNTIPSAGLFDVLEHIEDDVSFLTMLSNALMPQGKLLVTVPAYNFLWAANDKRVGHYRRYTLRALSNKLSSCGFSIDYSTYLFAPMPVPILLIRTIPYRLGLYRHVSKERIKKELNPKKSLFLSTLNKILSLELYFLNKGKIMPFGSTCLIVATKK